MFRITEDPKHIGIFLNILFFHCIYELYIGPSNSVGIATDYGLDCQRSNPNGDEILHPSSSAQGPTQTPVKWVPGLSRG